MVRGTAVSAAAAAVFSRAIEDAVLAVKQTTTTMSLRHLFQVSALRCWVGVPAMTRLQPSTPMVAAMVPATTSATKVVKSMEEEEEDVVVAFMLPEQLSTAAPRSEKKNLTRSCRIYKKFLLPSTLT